MSNLNELAKQIHKNNVIKGFYEDGRKVQEFLEKNGTSEMVDIFKHMETGQRLALITSEVSEALEADRHKKEFGNMAQSWKDRLLHKTDDETFNAEFKIIVKDTKQDEIADVIIRCLDFCGANDIDIDFHIAAKLKYNSLREYKHGKTY